MKRSIIFFCRFSTIISKLGLVLGICSLSLYSCRKDIPANPQTTNPEVINSPAEFKWSTTRNLPVNISMDIPGAGEARCRLDIYKIIPDGNTTLIFSASIQNIMPLKATVTIPTASKEIKLSLTKPDGSVLDVTTEVKDPLTYIFKAPGVKSSMTFSDADKDGVADLIDDFPNDPSRAYKYSYPEISPLTYNPMSPVSWATYCFEDLWPSMGDFDMNDLVVNYKYEIITNADHTVKQILAHFKVKAAGSCPNWKHGFGLALNGIPASAIDAVTGYRIRPGSYITLNSKGFESNKNGDQSTPCVIIVFDDHTYVAAGASGGFFNTMLNLPCGESDQVDMTINLVSNTTIKDSDVIPGNFNPFMIRNKNREYEIHRPDFQPTSWNNPANFHTLDDASVPENNSFYKTKTGLPWGLDLPVDFNYATEFINIQLAYPQFKTWAESGGTVNQDWYNYPSSEPGKIFVCNGTTPPGGNFTCGDNVTDSRDGKIYHTVLIGNQCWMKENMNIGTHINSSQSQSNNGTIEKFCYNDQESNCDVYGGLYQWAELMQYVSTEKAQGICPNGWHIPSYPETKTLAISLGGEDIQGGFSVVGSKMKSTGTIQDGSGLWNQSSYHSSNASGFTALPSGYYYNNGYASGSFEGLHDLTFIYTSSIQTYTGRFMVLTKDMDDLVIGGYDYPGNAMPVRCISNNLYPENNSAPTATNVRQTGNAAYGQSLTGVYTYSDADNDPEGISTYQWYRSDDANGTNEVLITNRIAKTYEIQSADMNKFIRFSVIPVASSGIYQGVEVKSTQYSGPVSAGSYTCGTPVSDTRDGHVYNTIQIGNQCWMKENLNIGVKIDGSSTQTNNGTVEKYCYNNQESNCNTYGGLYLWDEAMQYSNNDGSQGICPAGWHIPTETDFTLLMTFLGGDMVAGGKVKETTTDHWLSPNTGATNSSGFTALPGGYTFNNGWFNGVNGNANFWTSTAPNPSPNPGHVNIYYDHEIMYVNNSATAGYGYSVRCIKN